MLEAMPFHSCTFGQDLAFLLALKSVFLCLSVAYGFVILFDIHQHH